MSTDFSAKKIHCLGRVVEGLFLSKAGPKKMVFVISDSNYKKTNVRCVENFCNFGQI